MTEPSPSCGYLVEFESVQVAVDMYLLAVNDTQGAREVSLVDRDRLASFLNEFLNQGR